MYAIPILEVIIKNTARYSERWLYLVVYYWFYYVSSAILNFQGVRSC